MRPSPLPQPLAALVFSLGVLGCTPPLCAPGALEAALASAAPGDVVRVGACRLAGAFVVPDGVTLEGEPGTVLVSVAGGAPVVDARAATEVRLRALAIEVGHGGVGLRVAGGGRLAASSLRIEVERGIAIGIDATSATLVDVDLEGTVTAENAAFAGTTPATAAAFGLVARDLDGHALTLDRVHVAGFAMAGATFAGGAVTWTGAGVPDVESTRAVGIAFVGTDATLEGLEIVDLLSGPGLPGVAVAAIPGGARAALHADALVVRDGDGHGLFASGTDVVLTDARFTSLGLAGVRLQGGTLVATNLTCVDDGGAGVLAIDAESVAIEGAVLADQRLVPLPSGTASVLVGDGLEVVRDERSVGAPPLSLTLRDATFSGNARTGLLLDAADGPLGDLVLEAVTVDAQGSATGAIAQRVAVPTGWDAMVLRTGAAVLNDARVSGLVDPVGIMMPPGLAPPDF